MNSYKIVSWLSKKILILAGSHFQIPVIKYAKSKGHYVITCDNRPLNPGHSLADKYYNISTTDLDGILELSRREKIDGILAYGSDIAAPAAAYVSEKLGLPGNSFDTVKKLTDKGLFRKFLLDNNFHIPEFKVLGNLKDAETYYNSINYPVIMKPVDSSGSKGVTKLEPHDVINNAYQNALNFSIKKEIIIEEELNVKRPHIHGEAFYYNGGLKFILLGDQYFSNVNPCAPLSTTLPGMHHREILADIRSNIISLLSRIKFITGGLNIEVIIDPNNKIYFLEIGPRNGGNLMPELAELASGFNLAAANVNAALDYQIDFNYSINTSTFYSQLILHSYKEGKFIKPDIPERFKSNEVKRLIYYSEGDTVEKYSSSQNVIGIILYKFSNIDNYREFLDYILHNNLVKLQN